jgi:molybdenum cofactor guanylyltransferase
VIADRQSGFQGPLAGVEAGLSFVAAHCPGVSWAVTVPGDTPFIPRDLVARLAAAVEAGSTMAVATSEAGFHPVVALWPVSMGAALARSLAEGERKASRWVKSQGAGEVFFEAVEVGGARVDPFFNINHPEDLEAARTLIATASAS